MGRRAQQSKRRRAFVKAGMGKKSSHTHLRGTKDWGKRRKVRVR